MNSINLTGRLTREPELRTTQGGDAICKMRLAVDRMGRNTGVGYIDVAASGRPPTAPSARVTASSRTSSSSPPRRAPAATVGCNESGSKPTPRPPTGRKAATVGAPWRRARAPTRLQAPREPPYPVGRRR
jgi:hypothetical protein